MAELPHKAAFKTVLAAAEQERQELMPLTQQWVLEMAETAFQTTIERGLLFGTLVVAEVAEAMAAASHLEAAEAAAAMELQQVQILM